MPRSEEEKCSGKPEYGARFHCYSSHLVRFLIYLCNGRVNASANLSDLLVERGDVVGDPLGLGLYSLRLASLAHNFSEFVF